MGCVAHENKSDVQQLPQTHRGTVVEVDNGRDEVLLRDGVEGGVQEVGRGAGPIDLGRSRYHWPHTANKLTDAAMGRAVFAFVIRNDWNRVCMAVVSVPQDDAQS